MNKAVNPNVVKIERKGDKKILQNKGLNFNPSRLIPGTSHDLVKKEIKNISSKILEDENSTNMANALYAALGKISQSKFSVSDIQVGSPEYHSLNDYSKIKFLWSKLTRPLQGLDEQERKEEEENRAQIKKTLNTFLQLQNWDNDTGTTIRSLGGDKYISYLAEVLSNHDNAQMLTIENTFEYEMDDILQDKFIQLLENTGIPKHTIQKFKDISGRQDLEISSIGDQSEIDSVNNSNLLQINTSQRDGVSDLNPMLYDLNIELGLKLFSPSRLKEIYKKFFLKIVTEITEEVGGIKPSYNELNTVLKRLLQTTTGEADGSKKSPEEDKQIYQYTIEWDIPDNINQQHLKEIVNMLNQQGFNINTTPNNKQEIFKHPIKTSTGLQKYQGHFENGESGFIGSSVVIIENKDKNTRKLRLTTNDFKQDEYVYILSQISHFLETQNFITPEQLYFNIYDKYNSHIYGEKKLYDITVHKQQYESVMKNVVIPLSLEGNDLNLKPQNTLLGGIYGGGKSQILLKFLQSKVFQIDDKQFNLNANVIYIDLQSFKAMLASPIGGIRTKLDEIHGKTNTPIILVIEDIDTLVNEKHVVNDEITQAMTLFFEGISSIPITVLATANAPSKLSERLIRPNRIYEIIQFYELGENEKKKILDIHIKEKELDISEDLKQKLMDTKVLKYGTASHIGFFCSKLQSTQKFNKLLSNTSEQLTEEEILDIANNINISITDMKNTIKETKNWYKEVTGNEPKKIPMGFTNSEEEIKK